MKISDPKSKPLENDEYEAIKLGLDGYNEKFTGGLLREDVSSVIKRHFKDKARNYHFPSSMFL